MMPTPDCRQERAYIAEYAGQAVGGGGSFLGGLVGRSDADKRLRTVDEESGACEQCDGAYYRHVGEEYEQGHEYCSGGHADEAHAVGLSVEDMVGGPSGGDGAHDGEEFKDGY